jgi:hypothetical protein
VCLSVCVVKCWIQISHLVDNIKKDVFRCSSGISFSLAFISSRYPAVSVCLNCRCIYSSHICLNMLFVCCPYFRIIIIIIIGSTALHGPWASSEASDSWSIRLLFLHISWQESFPVWGCQPHAQPPAILEGRCFLSGLSLSRLVPISKRQDLAFCPCMT